MDGDARYERWELKGQWKSRICPRRLVTAESVAWFRLWNFYREGHLAIAGGVLDQPAAYLQAMAYISVAWKQANERDSDT